MHQLSILRLARAVRRHVHNRTHGRDSGAVATIVAILLGFGVILGCAALTIDTGSLMWERRQVQNGADAVSLAAAKSCATANPCDPNSLTAAAGLTALAGQNAADGATALDGSICGNAAAKLTNPLLPLCGSLTGALVDCPPVPSSLSSTAWVEARTKTRTSGGSTILPPILAQTLAGGGYSGETVKACARAAWGPLGSYTTSVPVTFSYCEWQRATAYNPLTGTGLYPPGPAYPTPAGSDPGYGGAGQPAWPVPAVAPSLGVPGQETIIYLQDHGSASNCANWNGHDTAGGFGYLTANGCLTSVSTDGWVQVDTGSSAPCDMSSYYHKVIFLPVFDCVTRSGSQPVGAPTAATVCDYGTGNNTWYHIQGFAKFYLSGYKTGGSQEMARTATGTVPCSNGDRCLSGWFLQGLVPVGSIDTSGGSGPPLGVSVVQVAG